MYWTLDPDTQSVSGYWYPGHGTAVRVPEVLNWGGGISVGYQVVVLGQGTGMRY